MALTFSSALNGGVPNIGSQDYGFGDYYRQGAAVYNSTLQGFNSVLQAQEANSRAVQSRYDSLTSGVLGNLNGAEAARKQEIEDQYAAAMGSNQQSAVDRGLGNFTTLDSLQRGSLYDRSKAETDLAGQFGGLRAQYQSQLGSQAAGYAARAGEDQTALGQAALGFAGSWRSLTPDPYQYASLAQQQKQFAASQQQEQQLAMPQAMGTSIAQNAFGPGGSYRTQYYVPRTGSTFFGTGTLGGATRPYG